MTLGKTILRLVVGGLFAGHGAQKLFGWFGGHGPEGTGQFFESSLGLAPGQRHAQTAGAAELGGGLMLATGLGTPLAAAAISGTMITAIRKVHLDKGPWVSEGGFEYNAVVLAVLFALTDEDSGPGWAMAQLAAGAAGSWLAIGPLNEAPGGQEEPAAAPPGDPASTA
ncbi:MAG TPA: DoxX family protein [Solirubrobacteraceae bacterium]|nr:DoxX family protein [Solirubrobacteraceae bacterium]